MDHSSEALPIKASDLKQYNDKANSLVMKVTYAPRKPAGNESRIAGDLAWRTPDSVQAKPAEISVLAIARALNPNTQLVLQDQVNHAVTSVWEGIRIGAYVRELYEKASNLEVLIQRNKSGILEPAHKVEFREKQTTAAAIAIFVTAYYIAWELSRSTEDDSKVEIEGIGETNLQSHVEGINCMMFHYASQLGRVAVVQTPADFARVTRLFFRGVVNEISSRAASLKLAEPFTARNYKLDSSEFTVSGFTANVGAAHATVEFNRVELAEIVGNKAAKRQAKLLAQRLMCYDFVHKKNPMHKLGGLPKIRMGWGPPGTGKSMLIAAVATLLKDYCDALKYPFAFRPLPDNIISTFQGGSAGNTVDWFVGFQDPTRILYGTIDDGEVVMEDRTRQNVSSGVREFIGVFLRRTEGAYAINHGNFVIDVFTNLPDQIDKAVLSRIVSRFLIAGAESPTDFVDQDYLWWKKYRDADAAFIDMADPVDEYMITQAMLKNLSDVSDRHNQPQDERLLRIFNKVSNQHDPTEQIFFGELYGAVKAEFPFFTSRDVRNIQSAVDGRVLDFELPDEWLEKPELFYFKPYEDKLTILKDMMRQNMGNLSFGQVRLQETVAYLDEMVRIAEVTRQRKIDEMVEGLAMQVEARDVFTKKHSTDNALTGREV